MLQVLVFYGGPPGSRTRHQRIMSPLFLGFWMPCKLRVFCLKAFFCKGLVLVCFVAAC